MLKQALPSRGVKAELTSRCSLGVRCLMRARNAWASKSVPVRWYTRFRPLNLRREHLGCDAVQGQKVVCGGDAEVLARQRSGPQVISATQCHAK
jgi:hypothetical protein